MQVLFKMTKYNSEEDDTKYTVCNLYISCEKDIRNKENYIYYIMARTIYGFDLVIPNPAPCPCNVFFESPKDAFEVAEKIWEKYKRYHQIIKDDEIKYAPEYDEEGLK